MSFHPVVMIPLQFTAVELSRHNLRALSTLSVGDQFQCRQLAVSQHFAPQVNESAMSRNGFPVPLPPMAVKPLTAKAL